MPVDDDDNKKTSDSASYSGTVDDIGEADDTFNDP